MAMEGNQQKMREALEAILRCVEPICKYAKPDGEQPTALFAIADTVRDIVAKALSAPARNCDVGTPEEQGERCLAQFEQWRRKGDGKKLITAIMTWAQMPYTAEEGGADHA